MLKYNKVRFEYIWSFADKQVSVYKTEVFYKKGLEAQLIKEGLETLNHPLLAKLLNRYINRCKEIHRLVFYQYRSVKDSKEIIN